MSHRRASGGTGGGAGTPADAAIAAIRHAVEANSVSAATAACDAAAAVGASALAKLLEARLDASDATALHLAAERGELALAHLLLERGAQPNAVSTRGTPLMLAAKHGNVEVCAALVRAGARATYIHDDTLETALHIAAAAGKAPVIAFLADCGARLEAVDSKGQTPLHVAAYHGREEAVDALLAAGANADARTVNVWSAALGQRASDLACQAPDAPKHLKPNIVAALRYRESAGGGAAPVDATAAAGAGSAMGGAGASPGMRRLSSQAAMVTPAPSGLRRVSTMATAGAASLAPHPLQRTGTVSSIASTNSGDTAAAMDGSGGAARLVGAGASSSVAGGSTVTVTTVRSLGSGGTTAADAAGAAMAALGALDIAPPLRAEHGSPPTTTRGRLPPTLRVEVTESHGGAAAAGHAAAAAVLLSPGRSGAAHAVVPPTPSGRPRVAPTPSAAQRRLHSSHTHGRGHGTGSYGETRLAGYDSNKCADIVGPDTSTIPVNAKAQSMWSRRPSDLTAAAVAAATAGGHGDGPAPSPTRVFHRTASAGAVLLPSSSASPSHRRPSGGALFFPATMAVSGLDTHGRGEVGAHPTAAATASTIRGRSMAATLTTTAPTSSSIAGAQAAYGGGADRRSPSPGSIAARPVPESTYMPYFTAPRLSPMTIPSRAASRDSTSSDGVTSPPSQPALPSSTGMPSATARAAAPHVQATDSGSMYRAGSLAGFRASGAASNASSPAAADPAVLTATSRRSVRGVAVDGAVSSPPPSSAGSAAVQTAGGSGSATAVSARQAPGGVGSAPRLLRVHGAELRIPEAIAEVTSRSRTNEGTSSEDQGATEERVLTVLDSHSTTDDEDVTRAMFAAASSSLASLPSLSSPAAAAAFVPIGGFSAATAGASDGKARRTHGRGGGGMPSGRSRVVSPRDEKGMLMSPLVTPSRAEAMSPASATAVAGGGAKDDGETRPAASSRVGAPIPTAAAAAAAMATAGASLRTSPLTQGRRIMSTPSSSHSPSPSQSPSQSPSPTPPASRIPHRPSPAAGGGGVATGGGGATPQPPLRARLSALALVSPSGGGTGAAAAPARADDAFVPVSEYARLNGIAVADVEHLMATGHLPSRKRKFVGTIVDSAVPLRHIAIPLAEACAAAGISEAAFLARSRAAAAAAGGDVAPSPSATLPRVMEAGAGSGVLPTLWVVRVEWEAWRTSSRGVPLVTIAANLHLPIREVLALWAELATGGVGGAAATAAVLPPPPHPPATSAVPLGVAIVVPAATAERVQAAIAAALVPLSTVADSLFVPPDAFHGFVATVKRAGIAVYGVDKQQAADGGWKTPPADGSFTSLSAPHLFVRRLDVLAVAGAVDEEGGDE